MNCCSLTLHLCVFFYIKGLYLCFQNLQDERLVRRWHAYKHARLRDKRQ